MTLMRWSDIDEENNAIKIVNHKVSKIKKKRKIRYIAILPELADLLIEMGWEEKKGSHEYIIAPHAENRELSVNDQLSRAFSHFWSLSGGKEGITLKHLRKTYVTLMSVLDKKRTGKITGQSQEIIEKAYRDPKRMANLVSKVSLAELEEHLEKSESILSKTTSGGSSDQEDSGGESEPKESEDNESLDKAA